MKDVKTVVEKSKIDITLKGYSIEKEDNSREGTDKSQGCESRSTDEEMSVEQEDNDWCEFCRCHER